MPTIRPSADLRNNYNDISEMCHKYNEPVFITKNGKGDLAVMSMELFEMFSGRFELYNLLKEGLKEAEEGKVQPVEDAMADIKRELGL